MCASGRKSSTSTWTTITALTTTIIMIAPSHVATMPITPMGTIIIAMTMDVRMYPLCGHTSMTRR
ncbi:hypothetical protein D3C86_2128210 [compost metagenome]